MAKTAVSKKRTKEVAATREPRGQRKDRFMMQAAQVFAEYGLHQATMDQVASRIGVSKIILYRYFASKDDLISSILEGVVRRCLDVNYLIQEFGSGTRAALKAARENPDGFLMLLRHAPHDPVFGHYYEEVLNTVRKHTEADIRKSGGAKGVSPAIVRMSIELGSMFTLRSLKWWMEHGREAQDEDFICWNAGVLSTLIRPDDVMENARVQSKPVVPPKSRGSSVTNKKPR